MEKTIVEFGKKENKLVTFEGQDFFVNPVIPIEVQAAIIQQYLMDYFHPETTIDDEISTDYISAEFKMKLAVLDRQTTIDISKPGDDDYAKSLVTQLWLPVINEIENFDDFEITLYKIVSEMKEERELKMSVGAVLDGLSSKVGGFIDKLNSIPLGDFKDMATKASDTLKELENSPVSGLFKEAEKHNESKA